MFTKERLELELEKGFISKRPHPHPDVDLHVYNYTASCEYNKAWNKVNKYCRGLVLDSDLNVVARPFQKFFNIEQAKSVPNVSNVLSITEKLDGSLGIVFFYMNEWHLCTRGAFESEQATVGKIMLHEKYRDALEHMDTSKTYLFEIIYPANRIVVDYGTRTELVLLAVIDTAAGKDVYPLPSIPLFPAREEHDFKDVDFRALKQNNYKNQEGYVVLFKNGLRVKIKFETYMQIHRIKYQLSDKFVLDLLTKGETVRKYLDEVPDEFLDEALEKEKNINDIYFRIDSEIEQAWVSLQEDISLYPRKRIASIFHDKYPDITGILFSKLDDKPYKDQIWKRVKQEYNESD